VLDPQTGVFTYVNAGHNPPYLFTAIEGDAIRHCAGLDRRSYFGEYHLEARSVKIEGGETMVLYTMG